MSRGWIDDLFSRRPKTESNETSMRCVKIRRGIRGRLLEWPQMRLGKDSCIISG